MRKRVLAILLAGIACGGSGETTEPATAVLEVEVVGLPTGASASVSVTGAGGFSRTLTVTERLTGLAAGTYVVTAANVTASGSTYVPAQATQSVTLAVGQTATTTVRYAVLPDDVTLGVEVVAAGLSSPLYVTSPPRDPRLFVVEQVGRIRIVANGALLATPFLDVRSRITSGGERGLLSVAFHPSYATNGFFYVNFTDLQGNTRVERFRVSSDPNVADAASSTLILAVAQPYANHNGGLVMFGPDGMFYIGMGDGGSGGDPLGHGQNRNSLLGKMLRIDVDGTPPYGIPSTNPFVGQASVRPEIWATGLRNPWRFSFDRTAGQLYIADVGQGSREEINAVSATQAGLNYGWNVMEGSACYSTANCSRTGLTLPVLDYGHSVGCSVTGGYVYRGTRIPEIVGRYFYSDYCSGWLRSFRLVNGVVTAEREWSVGALGAVSSLGEDANGELYVTNTNTVYRIVRR
jgi:glucose/arabinose dehydrogenase